MSHALPITHASSSVSPASPSPSAATSSPASAAGRRRRHLWTGWTGIVGCIALAGFLGIFSLDTPVFSLAFLYHNTPSIVILIGAALAWRWSWLASLWMFAAAAATLVVFRPWPSPSTPWITTVPLAILAVLFAVDAMMNRRAA